MNMTSLSCLVLETFSMMMCEGYQSGPNGIMLDTRNIKKMSAKQIIWDPKQNPEAHRKERAAVLDMEEQRSRKASYPEAPAFQSGCCDLQYLLLRSNST